MHIKLKMGIANILRYSGVLALVHHFGQKQQDLILTLHRVLPLHESCDCYDPHMVLTTSVFEELLKFLKKEYEIVTLNTLLSTVEGSSRMQRIALTFDDGWKDTFQYAFPLLLRYQVPATVFICSSLVGSSAMLPEERLANIFDHCSANLCIPSFLKHLATWGGVESLAESDDWRSFAKTIPLSAKFSLISHLEQVYGLRRDRTEQFMSWKEIRVMASHGIEIGSHTANHATLNVESRDVIQHELNESRDAIAGELGKAPRYLSYPNGSYNYNVMLFASEAKYSHAFTTDHGTVSSAKDTMAIPRIAMDNTVAIDEKGKMHAARVALHLSRLREYF